ncbi:hypothetical protein GCM10009550_60440 [Actinocorallia libanotica]|uniref:Uncharacterized protein n=1 Tax=Actinocorallia libanotica TaxID=46162 RepID=A0ABN1RU69_9ACTN
MIEMTAVSDRFSYTVTILVHSSSEAVVLRSTKTTDPCGTGRGLGSGDRTLRDGTGASTVTVTVGCGAGLDVDGSAIGAEGGAGSEARRRAATTAAAETGREKETPKMATRRRSRCMAGFPSAGAEAGDATAS